VNVNNAKTHPKWVSAIGQRAGLGSEQGLKLKKKSPQERALLC
jgi:hypothetical protein